jgi:hypothetical protein
VSGPHSAPTVLFFRGGVRGDIFGYFFGPKDFFRKQVKAGENEKGVNIRLRMRARNGLKENSLSNGTLLWWSAVLLDGLLSLVRHGLGVFSSGAGGEDVK